jgi:superfamily I DNA and/or RNA helicase
MNKKLMEFPNNEFYESHLKTDSEIENIKLGDLIDTNDDDIISFIDTSYMPNNQEKQLKDSKSIINICERDICIKLVNQFISQGINPNDIGIITPYSDQANIISDMTDVEVKTVDGFQGREKEIIIISTVRSNDEDKIGFLSDLRRLNVAITRAKRRLIIVGNKQTLSSNPTYKRMIDSIKNNS